LGYLRGLRGRHIRKRKSDDKATFRLHREMIKHIQKGEVGGNRFPHKGRRIEDVFDSPKVAASVNHVKGGQRGNNNRGGGKLVEIGWIRFKCGKTVEKP